MALSQPTLRRPWRIGGLYPSSPRGGDAGAALRQVMTELYVNLKAAEALGTPIAPSVVATPTRVIR